MKKKNHISETLLGPRALLDIAVPTGVDADYLLRMQLEQGMTLQEVITVAATAIGEANENLMERYGGLLTITNRISARYRQGDGTRTMTPLKSEFAAPDGVRSQKIGHMLPRNDYADATEWSAEWLERANREDVRDDLMEIRDRWINRNDFDVLNRLLSSAEESVGTSGFSPGWAIGSGTNVNYIPPQWRGYKFDSTHTHYIRVNAAISASNAASTLETAAKELSHHGFTGRKVAILSEADLDTYLAMDGKKFVLFKPREFTIIQGGTDPISVIDGEIQGVPGEVFGYFSSKSGVIELRYHERVPAGYGWVGKSFGLNNMNNPLAVRTEEGRGFGLMVVPELASTLTPELEKLKFRGTHGVGVNDRLNGVAFQIASGAATYEDPTIT